MTFDGWQREPVRSFGDLVAEAEAADVGGWGFGWLLGRAMEERHVSLHERIHGTAPPAEPAPATTRDEPHRIRHCWVTDDHGRLPGLLLEWRRMPAGWQGCVVRPVLEDGRWVVVAEWLVADRLEPTS